MKRTKTVVALVALCAVMGVTAGCSSDEPDTSTYYEQMRSVEAFADFDDDELDEVGKSSCELVETAVRVEGKNSDGLNALLSFMGKQGVDDVDGFIASTAIVAEHCPMDITE